MTKRATTRADQFFALICALYKIQDVCGTLNFTISGDFMAVGETLELNCTSTGTTKALRITFRGENLAQEYIEPLGQHGIRAIVPSVNVSNKGLYICHDTASETDFIGAQILIGYPPRAPRLRSCVSLNFEDLKCIWETFGEDELKIPTVSDVHYSIGNSNRVVSECPNMTQDPLTCHWPRTAPEPRDAFKPGFIYNVRARTRNRLGNATSITEVNTTLKVKPLPVTDLTARAMNSFSVRLTWQIIFPETFRADMNYMVIVTNAGNNNTTLTTKKGSVSRNEDSSRMVHVTVSDGLLAYTQYRFTIRIKPEQGGFWSDGRQIQCKTDEAAPDVGPRLSRSSFTESPEDNELRALYLYWQPPDPRYTHGDVKDYEVKVTNLETNRSQSLSSITRLSRKHSYWVDVRCRNKAGLSLKPTRLFLPRSSDVLAMTWKQTAEQKEKNVTVFWKTSDNDQLLKSVRVHYCKGEVRRPNRIVAICENGTYRCETVNASQASWSKLLDKPEMYVFGMSMETKKQTSGIHWIDCVFQTGKVPGKIIFLKGESIEETAIQLSWKPLQCGQSALSRILLFQTDYSSEARESCENGTRLNISGDVKLSGAAVPDLQPFTAYSVCIRAFSKAGPGPWSDVMHVTTRFPVIKVVVCILVPVFVIGVAMATFFWCKRQYCVPMVIEMPNASLDYDDGYAYASPERENPAFTTPDTPQNLLPNPPVTSPNGAALLKVTRDSPVESETPAETEDTSLRKKPHGRLDGTCYRNGSANRKCLGGPESADQCSPCTEDTSSRLSELNRRIDTSSVNFRKSASKETIYLKEYPSYSRFVGSNKTDKTLDQVDENRNQTATCTNDQTESGYTEGDATNDAKTESGYCGSMDMISQKPPSSAEMFLTYKDPTHSAEVCHNMENPSRLNTRPSSPSTEGFLEIKHSSCPAGHNSIGHMGRSAGSFSDSGHSIESGISNGDSGNVESYSKSAADSSFTTDDIDSLTYSKVAISQENIQL